MEIQKEEIEKFLETVKKYQTIREGASDFRNESAKDPELDKKSFGKGFEHGIYYAIESLFGTEFVEDSLDDKSCGIDLQAMYDKASDRINNMDTEIVYFSLNNWMRGHDYPEDEKYKRWVGEARGKYGEQDTKDSFLDEEWVKKNKLCVLYGAYDMSTNILVSAPRAWVLENCPELLSDKTYEYDTLRCSETVHHVKKYADFVCVRDDKGRIRSKVGGWDFLEYKDENIGTTWYDEDEQMNDDEDE